MDQFTFKSAKEVFGHGITAGISFAVHALTNAVRFQLFPIAIGGILDTPVAVED